MVAARKGLSLTKKIQSSGEEEKEAEAESYSEEAENEEAAAS